MAQVQELQDLLTILAGKAYIQAPSADKMVYPCAVYNVDAEAVKHADNKPYSRTVGYQVTVIDRNPRSEIPAKIAALPMCTFQRFYVKDNLNHTVYKLFF